MLMKLQKLLLKQNTNIYIIDYNGIFFINKNYLEVWKYIFDFKKLNSIVPIFGENIEYNDLELRIGSFLKFFSNSSKNIVYMQIIEINTPKKRNFFKSEIKINWH